jgi:hypothetical protein
MFSAVAVSAWLNVAMARVLDSLMGIPKLKCVVDELAVLLEWTNYGMSAQKGHYFLFRSLSFDKRPDGPEMKGRVTKGDLAGLLNRPRGMAVGEVQEAKQHPRCLDATGLDHGL